MNEICVIIPAYNEAQSLDNVLCELVDNQYTVIVVDDGSDDATSKVSKQYPVHLLIHPINLGQGAALNTGLKYALGLEDVKYIITFDADGQHIVSDIPRLVETMQNTNCDVVLGSRFCKGGEAKNIRFLRRITLFLALWFTKFTTGLKITDTHNGLRCFSPVAARRIRITQNRMAHASEILQEISLHNLSYTEIPVTVIYSDYSVKKGQSFLGGLDILFDIIRGRF